MNSRRGFRLLRSRLRARVTRYPDLDRLTADGLRLGRNVIIGRHTYIGHVCPWLITIGDHTVIGMKASIFSHDNSTKLQTGYSRGGLVNIGARVYVGAHAVILPGVTIRDDAIIGAGSVVSRDVPPGAVVAGNPARIHGTTTDFKRKHLARLAEGPCWDARGLPGAVTPDLAQQMRDELRDGRIGYIP